MSPTHYLKRIGYQDALTPTETALSALHERHLQRIPFENLSIGLGQPIVLDERRLYEKIVDSGRGGFCYELNGLFAWLLRELGYDVTYLSAEVMGGNGEFSAPYDHLALMVLVENRPFLADVGFGACFRRPMRLDSTEPYHDGFDAYRLVPAGAYHILERQNSAGTWEPQYRFTLQPEPFSAFEEMCRYHQTSPASSFTQRTICTRATETGRVTLANDRFILTENGRRNEELIPNEPAYSHLLREWFKIELARAPFIRT